MYYIYLLLNKNNFAFASNFYKKNNYFIYKLSLFSFIKKYYL